MHCFCIRVALAETSIVLFVHNLHWCAFNYFSFKHERIILGFGYTLLTPLPGICTVRIMTRVLSALSSG